MDVVNNILKKVKTEELFDKNNEITDDSTVLNNDNNIGDNNAG